MRQLESTSEPRQTIPNKRQRGACRTLVSVQSFETVNRSSAMLLISCGPAHGSSSSSCSRKSMTP